ncbi:heme-binding protein [Notoacmeibacter sp. MSK16QG-6]|uniref:GlcG/HbpS family heme-binding protein n=1 Tax=Notoacmeibacter sp. MSK16QG-6 TaxID=2957982 RepID=UPI00209E84A5|nr:heme-binding protein [Notoacmeibacter sp. MSK16QG-6]MCP1200622.1 heme-binding protein [Notoacmeibacter sp. MSK16QG-6]
MKTLHTIALAACLSPAWSVGASALEDKKVLSLDVANAMATSCLAHQKESGYKPINVVVVDDGGNIVLVNKQDGACKACGAIATNKARTAALFDNTTRNFEKLSYGDAKDGVGAELPGIALVPGLIAFPGGLPIHANGVVIGGIGVSGASGDEDEQCATAAIDAVSEMLN